MQSSSFIGPGVIAAIFVALTIWRVRVVRARGRRARKDVPTYFLAIPAAFFVFIFTGVLIVVLYIKFYA
jgi:hypothetical protein